MTNTKTTQSTNIWLYAWLTWVVAALFYGIEFFQRVSPTVMASPIMHSLHIDATTLGAVTSLYLYAYAIAQIPVGMVLDRYGVRIPLTVACIAISLGSLLFAIGHALFFLGMARVLIGFGSAFAFIGTLKLVSAWFPDRYYPLMVGLTNTLGVIGAIAGEGPFAHMVDIYGWQLSLIIVGALGLLISILIYYAVRNHPLCIQRPKDCHRILAKQYYEPLKSMLRETFSSRQTWITALYAGLMVAPIIAFAELWSVPFLTGAYHLSNVSAAEINTFIFIGIGVGGPVNGLLVRLLRHRKLVMYIGTIAALACLSNIIFNTHISLILLYALMFAFGFFTSSMLLAFTLNKNRHPETHSATVTAFTNMIIMLMGAIYQPLIGFFLDHLWPGIKDAGNYSVADFRHALMILPATIVIALILLILTQDKSLKHRD